MLNATIILILLFMFEIATIALLFVLLGIRGAAQAFQYPALGALTPILVPKKYLSRVNSIEMFLTRIVTITGPMLAVLLLSFIDIHNILWLDPITFVLAVIPLLAIRIPKVDKQKEQKEENKKSFGFEFKEGLKFMKKKKGLFSLMFSFATTNLFVMPLFTLLNLYVYINHGGSEGNLAMVLAFNQAGSMLGTILFIFWKGLKKKVNGVAIGVFGGLGGAIIVALAPQGMFWLMCVGFTVSGFFFSMCNVHSQTLWQSVVPKEMLGRVFSVRYTLAQIISPISMVLGGIIASKISIQVVVLVSLFAGIVSFCMFYFFSNMKKLDQPSTLIQSKIKLVKNDSQTEAVKSLSS